MGENPRKEREKIGAITEKMRNPDRQDEMYKEYNDYINLSKIKPPEEEEETQHFPKKNQDFEEDSTVESNKNEMFDPSPEAIPTESHAIPPQTQVNLEPVEIPDQHESSLPTSTMTSAPPPQQIVLETEEPQSIEDTASTPIYDVLEETPSENEFPPPSHPKP